MYFGVLIVLMLVSFGIQAQLRSKFNHYSQIPTDGGLSGAEVAQRMLRDNAIYDVSVTSVEGQLTDHYDPSKKTVNLSADVYNGRSISAAAIAAHECGHAVQHQMAYPWLTMRNSLVPVVQVSSNIVMWVLLAGVLLIKVFPFLLMAGIILFAFTTLFAFITLPVEIDASRRGLAWIKSSGIMSSIGDDKAYDILKWAALTYVVAAIASLATLMAYIGVFNNRR